MQEHLLFFVIILGLALIERCSCLDNNQTYINSSTTNNISYAKVKDILTKSNETTASNVLPKNIKDNNQTIDETAPIHTEATKENATLGCDILGEKNNAKTTHNSASQNCSVQISTTATVGDHGSPSKSTTTRPSSIVKTTGSSTTSPPIHHLKPKITYSILDLPSISDTKQTNMKRISADHDKDPTDTIGKSADNFPQESDSNNLPRNSINYILFIVILMLSVPVASGIIVISYQRIKDYWSTRHYRRMDFLVDGMYND